MEKYIQTERLAGRAGGRELSAIKKVATVTATSF